MAEDKVTKKKLKSLQKKWIESAYDGDQEEGGALTMDFSELEGGKEEKGGKKKKKKKTKEEVLLPEEKPLPDVPMGEGMVDYEIINEMIQQAVNIEVERAIREIKAEIREQSESSKRELFEKLKLEIETLRQEIEFSRPSKGRRGLFERF